MAVAINAAGALKFESFFWRGTKVVGASDCGEGVWDFGNFGAALQLSDSLGVSPEANSVAGERS